MKYLLLIALTTLVAVSASAQQTCCYGWEDGGTDLGLYNPVTTANVSSPTHSGSGALEVVRGDGGTPQVYVAWVEGLVDGDQVTVTLWCYDTTHNCDTAPCVSHTAPSGRLWAHYNEFNDIDDYAGSASGLNDYGTGDGWYQFSYTWTFDGVSDPDRTGMVIEARVYSGLGDTVYYDDICVTAPTGTCIYMPEPISPVENLSWATIKSLYR